MATTQALDGAWKPVKIGAGGYIVGIDVASDGSMVGRTDTYGAYLWNGTSWDQIVTAASMPVGAGTPTAEGVYEIRFAPSDSNILYMEYDGRIYKSTDKGDHWLATSFVQVSQEPNGPNRADSQKLAIDPSNPDILFAGTQHDGLFVTRDGGQNWQRVTAVPLGADAATRIDPALTGIIFDPSSTVGGATRTIYAGTAGSGVYRSTDGGATWSALTGGPKDVTGAVIGSDGAYYAVGSTDHKLWKFANGTWTALLSDRPELYKVAIDPFDPQHIVGIMAGGGITESKNGGATWTGNNWGTTLESSNDIPWLEHSGLHMSVGTLAFDPDVRGKLWVSAGVGVWSTQLPATIEWNTPIVWNSHSQGIEQLVANDIIAGAGSNTIFGSWDRAFFAMPDPDAYASSYSGGEFSMGWSLDYASSNPGFTVGISNWWGIEQSGYSNDGGITWQKFAGLPAFTGSGIGGSIAASTTTNFIWAPANGYAPAYTLDGGVTWTIISIPGKTDWSEFHFVYYLDRTTITADRVLPNTFYLYDVATGVYVTRDGGVTWTLAHSGAIQPWSYYNAKIEAVPGSAGELYFTGGPSGGNREGAPGGQGFLHSTDGGATWTAVAGVREVISFGYGAPRVAGGPATIFIAGWVNGEYGIWRSTDNAQNWVQVGEFPMDSLDTVKTVSGDMDVYGRVYVGFSGSGYTYLDSDSAAAPTGPNTAPTVTATKSITLIEDGTSGAVAIGASDANGDDLTYTVAAGSAPAKGSVTFANGNFTYTPIANATGTDSFTVTVSDGKGGTITQIVTVNITAVNDAPMASAATQTVTTNEDVAKSITVSAGDVDGDNLTFAAAGAAKGVVTGGAGGVFTYTPNANASGTDSFTVTVSDGKGGTTTQTVTVNIAAVNDAPTVSAATQTVTTNEDVAKSITVSAADVEGDSLTFAAAGATKGVVTGGAGGVITYTPNANANGTDSFTVTVSDGKGGTTTQAVTVNITAVNDAPAVSAATQSVTTAENVAKSITVVATDLDGDSLTFAAAGATKGVVTGGAGGVFTYTPNTNTNGTDSFMVAVSDGKGGSTTQTVTVNITGVNDAPTVSATQSVTTSEDVARSITVSATDVDGDSLTFAAAGATKGVVTGGAGGVFTYTPNVNASGTDSFTVTVSDGKGGTITQTVTVNITAVNDAPMASAATQTVTTNEDEAKSITVSATDVDGDSLTYAAAGAGKGVVAGGAGGDFTYTPNANASGTDSFTVTVSDGKGGTTTQTVTVNIAAVNDAPTVSAATQTVTTNEDVAKSITVSAADVEGDSLTFVAAGATKGVVTGGAGGVFTYAPNANANGSDSFTVTVSDGKGGTTTQTVTVNIAAINDGPMVSAATQSVTTNEDVAKTILVSATDLDGDNLTYAAAGATKGVVTGGAGGVFSYTPNANTNGADSFTVTVSDGQGGTATQTVTVNIAADAEQTQSGVIFDGYLSGATVFIDVDNDGALDADEPYTITDANGYFTLTSNATGPIRAFGGTNIDTGELNLLSYSAPSGATVVNPLTILIQTLIEVANTGAATAQEQLKQVLGIDQSLELLHLDLIHAASTSAVALAAQKIAAEVAEIANLVHQNGGNGGAALHELAELIQSAGFGNHGTINLGAHSLLQIVVSAGLPAADSSVIAAIVQDLHSINTAIAAAMDVAGITAAQGNSAPEFASEVIEYSISAGTALLFSSTATDVDGDSLVYHSGAAAHGTVIHGEGDTFTYVAAAGYVGSDSITITATDTFGRSATQTIQFDVLAPTQGPVASVSQTVMTPGQNFGVTGFAGIPTNVFITGSAAGAEFITVGDYTTVGFSNNFASGGGDTIRLAGRASDFDISVSGNQVNLTSAVDQITLALPVGFNALTLIFETSPNVFGDSRSLRFVSDGNDADSLPDLFLGAQQVLPDLPSIDVLSFA